MSAGLLRLGRLPRAARRRKPDGIFDFGFLIFDLTFPLARGRRAIPVPSSTLRGAGPALPGKIENHKSKI
jgi:hypothetical protein